MVLCEIEHADSFLLTWSVLLALGFSATMLFSGSLFFLYYWNPTYEQWLWKTNKKYPSPAKVRDEIWQMSKGVVCGTFLPALALNLARSGKSKAFCNAERGVAYDVASFFLIWIACDFYEFFYHFLGHKLAFMWQFHRAHHVFFNPSPFAVIADEYVDQLFRSAPLLVIPLLFPVNMDILFFTFALFFYGYGTYLHWGYEFDFVDAHNGFINTAYHHYLHHAISGRTTPYNCGFMFTAWDKLFGTTYTGKCFCVKCDRAKGGRSRAEFEKIEKPDYSVLFNPRFWLSGWDSTVNEVKVQKEREIGGKKTK